MFLDEAVFLMASPLQTALGDVARKLPGDACRWGRQIAAASLYRAVADPPLPALAVARVVCPRARLGRLTMVTSADAVLEVLADPTEYPVGPYAGMRELAGEGVLGLDPPQHGPVRQRLADSLSAIETDRVRSWADALCADLIRHARLNGAVDVLDDLATPLATAFVHEFFWIPRLPEDDDEQVAGYPLADETWDLFEGCFLNLSNDPAIHASARRAADALRVRIDRLRASEPCPQWVSALGSTENPDGMPDFPEQTVTDLIGFATGTVPTVTEAIARVVDYLIDRPEPLRIARAAIAGGNRDRIWQVAQESLRFNPQSPGLPRSSLGSPETIVMAGTFSAMHDPSLVPRPGHFDPDRSAEQYLHFGRGIHRCLGERFARELITSAVTALLPAPELARAQGRAGRLTLVGPRPVSLLLTL